MLVVWNIVIVNYVEISISTKGTNGAIFIIAEGSGSGGVRRLNAVEHLRKSRNATEQTAISTRRGSGYELEVVPEHQIKV